MPMKPTNPEPTSSYVFVWIAVLVCALIGIFTGGCASGPADIGKPMLAANVAAAGASAKLDLAKTVVAKATVDATENGRLWLAFATTLIDGAKRDVVDVGVSVAEVQAQAVAERAENAATVLTAKGETATQRKRADDAESTWGYWIEQKILWARTALEISLAVVFAGWVASFFVTGPWGTVLGFLGTHILHWVTVGISSRISGVFGSKAAAL